MTGSPLEVRLAPGKCRECLCGIQESTGIWCALVKKTRSAREVELCRRSCPKAILDQPWTDPRDELHEERLGDPGARAARPGQEEGTKGMRSSSQPFTLSSMPATGCLWRK